MSFYLFIYLFKIIKIQFLFLILVLFNNFN